MLSDKFKGSFCGIFSAVCYGFNPFGAINLFKIGVNTSTMVFFRFLIASFLMAGVMLYKRENFKITFKEAIFCAFLGFVFGISAMALFYSYKFLDAGIAGTLLFTYPIFTAVLMKLLFKEQITVKTVVSMVAAFAGIVFLSRSESSSISVTGVIFVFISSITYAVYLIIINKVPKSLSSVKLTFYVIVFCTVSIYIISLIIPNNKIALLTRFTPWLYILFLAFVPTLISFITGVYAVKNIGSTPTAVMGAFEPLTAVVIGICIFGEHFSCHMLCGMVFIIGGVAFLVAGKSPQIDKEKVNC